MNAARSASLIVTVDDAGLPVRIHIAPARLEGRLDVLAADIVALVRQAASR